MGSAAGAAFWSAYLFESRRVKSTFTQRYRTRMPPPLGQAVERAMAVEPGQS
jgi:hypothetical protein